MCLEELLHLDIRWGGNMFGLVIISSGARIVCTLINALKRQGKRTGIAAVCHGGGGATAILVELV